MAYRVNSGEQNGYDLWCALLTRFAGRDACRRRRDAVRRLGRVGRGGGEVEENIEDVLFMWWEVIYTGARSILWTSSLAILAFALKQN
jgi:hypothetical protein